MPALSKNQSKFVKSLHQKKFREQHNCFIVEGTKMVRELIESAFKIQQIFVTPGNELTEYDSVVISPQEMNQISSLTTPPGILAVVEKPEGQELAFGDFNIILDGIKDPGNMGSILRSACWFGVEKVIMTPDCVDLFNPKVVQATMGALFQVSWCTSTRKQIIETAERDQCKLYAADMHGKQTTDRKWRFPLALVIGSESHGVSESMLDASKVIKIEQYGSGESLNAGVAAAVLLSRIAPSKE